MKKSLSIASVVLGLILMANTNVMAQDFSVGGGLAYGSEVEAIGIQGGATYNFTEEIRGTADVIIFFPDNYDWWELNVNGNYLFYSEEGINVYALAGLNYATVSVDLGQFGNASDSELGLNLGGGAEFGVDFANVYVELKYVLGNADQLGLSGGLRFPI